MRDYHLHSTFGDGKSSIDEMVRTASGLGFQEVAFTEHFSWFFVELARKINHKGIDMLPEEIEEYYSQCKNAEQKYGIIVLKGFEISYFEHDEEKTKRFIEEVKPDIVLLSVHHLDLLNDWKREDGRLDKAGYHVYLGDKSLAELTRQYGVEELHHAYFKRLNNAIKAGFDRICPKVGVAHLDVFSNNRLYDKAVAEPFIDKTVEAIANKGLALELNFHYFNHDNKEPRPPFEAAGIYVLLGGKEVWFGSDSHSTDQVLKAAKDHKVFEERYTNANGTNFFLF